MRWANVFSQDFKEGEAPIFLLASQVGGLGLTLTKADCVIVVDPVWNPRMVNGETGAEGIKSHNDNILEQVFDLEKEA
ncbi:hypothetical protein GIB67_002307 [Kingdonia uniflora]|uniref:Helicase C-terminal domain-containing protein n=1 Tax=Kingdonia uniflora TaxID=39325 RepID=A0A7J7KX27_9MAGN|nr:hypothetical protein GIB67_002307 [Kingdonia uniflora]